jgi:hypothetical protein
MLSRTITPGLLLGLVLALGAGPETALANDGAANGQPIQGVVQSVHGARLAVLTADGMLIEATLEFPAPVGLVGQHVSATLFTRGDSYFLAEPAFRPSDR